MEKSNKKNGFNIFKFIGFIFSFCAAPLFVSGEMIFPKLYKDASSNSNYKRFNKIYTIIGYVIFSLGIISNAILYPIDSMFYISFIISLSFNILHFVIGLFFLKKFASEKEYDDVFVVCKRCGQKYEKSFNFCERCGFKLDADINEYKNDMMFILALLCLIPSVLLAPLFNTGKYLFKKTYNDGRNIAKCKSFMDRYSIVGYILFGLPLLWLNISRLTDFYFALPIGYDVLFFVLNILHFVIGFIILKIYIRKALKDGDLKKTHFFCEQCGEMFQEGDTICNKCGSPIISDKVIKKPIHIVCDIIGVLCLAVTLLPLFDIKTNYFFYKSLIGIAIGVIGFIISKATKMKSSFPLIALVIAVVLFVQYFVTMLIMAILYSSFY